jgi:NAD(P)-dependent dehydrogenase (short-subunit alcohol dehydrogenase family)
MTYWLQAGNNAVITGGASGIGLAAARRFVEQGMNVLIGDVNPEALTHAAEMLNEAGPGAAHTFVCDVAEFAQVEALRDEAWRRFDAVHCLMNNAGAGLRTPSPWEDLNGWKKQLDINLWGIVHGCHAFIPAMLEGGNPGAVINTGSKQGITNPPGNYAYNLSKAGVRNYTESLAHALRSADNCRLTAHLLVPGFTYSAMISRFIPEKPSGAWTSEQTVDYMLESLSRGDFYILCPDNDTPRSLDEKRIQWYTDDLLENRSALSRWDPDYAEAYQNFLDE